MEIKDYLLRARKETNTSEHQISDIELLSYLNRRRNELANEIIRLVNEDFFYDIFTTDLIAGQFEYSFQECTPSIEGVKKFITLEVKRDDHYILIPKKPMNSLWFTLEQMENLSINEAFFDIKDSSIFLYPLSGKTVQDGIRGQVITSIKDLKLNDTESTIFPWHTDLRDYYELMYIWAKIDCRDCKQEFDKKQIAMQDFEYKKKQMISFLTNRYNSPMELQTPNLDHFKY